MKNKSKQTHVGQSKNKENEKKAQHPTTQQKAGHLDSIAQHSCQGTACQHKEATKPEHMNDKSPDIHRNNKK